MGQWDPQNDISPRRTGEDFLYVLVDTLRILNIQKYQSTYFFLGQNLQDLHHLFKSYFTTDFYSKNITVNMLQEPVKLLKKE